MAGTSRERPELARMAIPLEAVVTPLPARGGEALIRSLFEPLGWTVRLDPAPSHTLAGENEATARPRYFTLHLSGTERLSALLTHLYVLIPVLDDSKHYWVGEDEVEKLLARGVDWRTASRSRAKPSRPRLGGASPWGMPTFARRRSPGGRR